MKIKFLARLGTTAVLLTFARAEPSNRRIKQFANLKQQLGDGINLEGPEQLENAHIAYARAFSGRGSFQLPVEYQPLQGLINVKKTSTSGKATSHSQQHYSQFTAEQLASLPTQYLCQKRVPETDLSTEACCVGKDKECFTTGGCFCDESCQHFDDCCPDYQFTCANTFNLCLSDTQSDMKPDANQNVQSMAEKERALAEKEQAIKNGNYSNTKGQDDLAGADNAHHVAPNACCGPRKYNNGEQCCCFDKSTFQGDLLDGSCDENSCQ